MKDRKPRFVRPLVVAFLILATTLAVVSGIQFQSMGPAPAEAMTPPPSAAAPTAAAMSAAIEQRKTLLGRSVVASFVRSDGVVQSVWTGSLTEHPSWVSFETQWKGGVRSVVSAESIKQQLISYPPPGIPLAKSCKVLSSWQDEQKVERAQTDCIARDGFSFDAASAAAAMKQALEDGQVALTIPLTTVASSIIDPIHSPDRPLTLLSTGRSDFKGSGASRKANVRKAMNERVNNVIIPAGVEFSFNSLLGKVTMGNGWQMALTIFEGGELRPAPGGGICQSSTTLYRAALNAGLPVPVKKNHSLYVTYYEAHGVGLDATIFPGHQDLKFTNDTGGPLLVQSYTEGDEAFVNVYGYDDERTVTLSGPYFAKTAPADLLEDGKRVRTGEVVWIRNVSKDGSTSREVLSSRYKALPKSLPSRISATTKVVRGTSEMPLTAELISAR